MCIRDSFGTSIIDNVYHLVDEINASTQRMSDGERFGSNQYTDVEDGAYDDADLNSNKVGVVLKRKPGRAPAAITTPNAISQSSVAWWRLLEEQCYKIPGISQMAASGQKE